MKPFFAFGFVALLTLTGCSNYSIGGEKGPDGSYAGSTLNSPVTDQDPHLGGESSYPSSPSTGKEEKPVEKSNY